ncbi:MAG: molecular chaperone HtpG [Victivallaceae bacterium]|nr:molecular chaperone HtpG [Victivallaceae bacterium]
MAKEMTFKTEVAQLLDLMINSLYSNRDIFLRELVANAADALDKARFESLTAPDTARDWKIRVDIDKKGRTLTISDNGIGMSEEEVVEHIGTIAKSGTKAFMKMVKEKGSDGADLPEMIGQFGVGFYSAFMVAEKVEIRTKRSGGDAPAVLWSSNGTGSYTLDECPDITEPGTEVKLFLKPDADEYLERWKLTSIIHKYSDYIEYPIIIPSVKKNEDNTETVTDEVVNSQKAIWLRRASEVKDDEYKSFYGHIANYAGTEYLKAIHMDAEGTTEFKALLFLPKEAPFNPFVPELQKRGLQLYVKRVFITDECKELIPEYLRFVCGVVDSSDLPLNVSREILQQNPLLAKIRNAVTSKLLSEMKKMLENDRPAYEKFFHEFGAMLKEGIHTDYANSDKIKDLALYETMNGEKGKLVTLAEYISAMPESQKCIYYLTGDKRESLESNPGLEYYRKNGFDVLFMTDPIDEWLAQSFFQYQKKDLKPAIKGNFEGDDKNEELAEATKKHAKLIAAIKEALADNVSEVKFSSRLIDSPCCIVTEGGAMNPQLERLFKAMNRDMPVSKRILELNAGHVLIEKLSAIAEAGDRPDDVKLYAKVLYDQALITEGSPIPDPAGFAQAITKLMSESIK